MNIMGETANGAGIEATDDAGFNPASSTPPAQQPALERNETVDLSKQVAPKVATPVAAPRIPLHEIDKNVGNDIAKILGELKLPSRNAAKTPLPQPARTYDTSLATDPETAAAQQSAQQEQILEAARAVSESLPNSAPKSGDIRTLRTLKDDLQHVVKDNKISLVRAVALEEEKRHRPSISPAEEQAAQTHSSRIPIIVTLVLFFLGASALAGTYYVLQDRTIENVDTAGSKILFAERAVPMLINSLAPADVRREIAGARNAGGLPLGAILQILPVRQANAADETGTPLSFNDFMQSIGAHPPEELVRALSPDFFFGIHTVDENAPLFVIPVTSYERAFAGMLAWEKTLNSDLSPMFTAVPMQTVGADGVITERGFEDAVIRNFDVRLLKDEAGTIQLFYTFPTRNLLIIAESQYSFAELLSRLRADRKL